MSANLYAEFQDRFPANRSEPFIRYPDGVEISYEDLEHQTAELAGLLYQLEIRKGDRVAVQVEKSAQAVILYLACLRIGAIYLPLNPAYTQTELDYFLGDASPRLLVCDPSRTDELDALREKHGVSWLESMDHQGNGSLTDKMADADPRYEITDCDGSDLAAILYTSGTTGRSKGAMLTHDNLASNALTLHDYWGFEPGDVLLHALPIFHVHGLFIAINCVLMNGSSMWFLPKYDPVQVISLLPKSTVMMGVPTFYTRLLENKDFSRDMTSNMRLFISGSAPLLEETFHQFEERTGMRILERYGMTETGMITSNPLNGERVAGTVGYALPGIDIRIADENGNTVPIGEKGVLELAGPNVFKGYWQMPEKTAEEFRDDGYFITGDIASMTEDGRVSIIGRAKDLIITGGYNVYPKEVELLIDELPGVNESAVIGLPHPDFGEAVTAIIARSADQPPCDETSILTALNEELASYKRPKRVIFLEALPRNTMGKVQKAQLRKTYKALYI